MQTYGTRRREHNIERAQQLPATRSDRSMVTIECGWISLQQNDDDDEHKKARSSELKAWRNP
jgi:hypothetical protein